MAEENYETKRERERVGWSGCGYAFLCSLKIIVVSLGWLEINDLNQYINNYFLYFLLFLPHNVNNQYTTNYLITFFFFFYIYFITNFCNVNYGVRNDKVHES